jgi:GTP-binding protein EngB required for normal cell division
VDSRYNTVIVGQTGVGKSTLINYLYGQKIAEAGIGKPVTKNGFHPIDFVINGLPVTLFDSWGLEVGELKTWLSELKKEFEKRGVDQPANKWFHSVFYCIQAGGARIQDCDITIIKTFLSQNYKVSIILTKCDQVPLEDENKLRQELQAQIPGIKVIGVCSEEKTTRSGTTQAFGKEDVERQAYSDFFDSLIIRLPLHCKSIMEDGVDTWAKRAISTANEDVGFVGFNSSEALNKIKTSAEKILLELQSMANQEIKETLLMYGNFAERLGYPPPDLTDEEGYHDYFGRNQTYKVWKWHEIIFNPLAIVYGLFTGRDEAYIDAVHYINQCKAGLKKHIDAQVNNMTLTLTSAKSKATGKYLGLSHS